MNQVNSRESDPATMLGGVLLSAALLLGIFIGLLIAQFVK
jgi:hypothetical protein